MCRRARNDVRRLPRTPSLRPDRCVPVDPVALIGAEHPLGREDGPEREGHGEAHDPGRDPGRTPSSGSSSPPAWRPARPGSGAAARRRRTRSRGRGRRAGSARAPPRSRSPATRPGPSSATARAPRRPARTIRPRDHRGTGGSVSTDPSAKKSSGAVRATRSAAGRSPANRSVSRASHSDGATARARAAVIGSGSGTFANQAVPPSRSCHQPRNARRPKTKWAASGRAGGAAPAHPPTLRSGTWRGPGAAGSISVRTVERMPSAPTRTWPWRSCRRRTRGDAVRLLLDGDQAPAVLDRDAVGGGAVVQRAVEVGPPQRLTRLEPAEPGERDELAPAPIGHDGVIDGPPDGADVAVGADDAQRVEPVRRDGERAADAVRARRIRLVHGRLDPRLAERHREDRSSDAAADHERRPRHGHVSSPNTWCHPFT